MYDLASVEDKLRASLRPVLPHPEFVQRLRTRLLDRFQEPRTRTQPRKLHFALLGGAGLLSGSILVINGIRAGIAVLGLLGILVKFGQNVQENGTALPSRPAQS